MCSLQRNYDVIRNWERFETGPLTVLNEHNLEFLSLKEGYTCSSESILVKMPHCWKSHVAAQLRHNDFRIFADRSSRNNSDNGKTLVIYLTVI